MEKVKDIIIYDDEINNITKSISVIDEQIEYFRNISFLLFCKKKINLYNDRISNLETIKIYLCKRLENELEKKKNYLE